MTPNKLPPLPEPIAYANKMQLRAVESADSAILGRSVLMSRSITIKRSDPLYTADKMHAYGKLCSAEAFQLYVDANEARIDAELALRQSQSLPAGAVAGLVGKWRINSEICSGTGALERAVELSRCADQLAQALQADAREKGEIADLESDIDTLVDHNMALQSAIRDAIKIHSSFGTTADMADWLRDELDALATQPAQASEKVTGKFRAALLWLLWCHQGGSSEVGQPIRAMLGIGPHDCMTDEQVAEAKEYHSKPWDSATSSQETASE